MSTQHHNNIYCCDTEAEDRVQATQASQSMVQQQPISSSGFPMPETSSFYFAQSGRHGDDDFDSHVVDPFKRRDRSFSGDHSMDDVNSQDGDNSIVFDQQEANTIQYMSFFDREEPNVELDLDDLNDLLDYEKPKKDAADNSLIILSTSNHLGESGHQTQQEADEDAVYANERDECCSNQDQQRDLAQDSTYHSLFEHEQSVDSFDPFNFDKSFDDDRNSISLMLNNLPKSEYNTSNAFLINTCTDNDGIVCPKSYDPERHGLLKELISGYNLVAAKQSSLIDSEQMDIEETSRQSTQVTTPTCLTDVINAETALSDQNTLIPLPLPMPVVQASHPVYSNIKSNSKTVYKKLREVRSKAKLPKKKQKVIDKTPKLTAQAKLAQKRKSAQKKPNVIEFRPNNKSHEDIEEQKIKDQIAPSDQRTTSRRPKKGDRNYYQNFDFFFKRTCFRTMTLFFKLAYKPFFDKWKSNKKKSSILDSLVAFVNQEFPELLDKMTQKARFEFIELVKLLVLSHRHNKNDDFLKDPVVDFATVREPMYKYSKQAQDKFFGLSTFAFLFAWFATNPQAQAFAIEKFQDNSDERHVVRMTSEVTQLGQTALQHLGKQGAPKSFSLLNQAGMDKLAAQFSGYIAKKQAEWAQQY